MRKLFLHIGTHKTGSTSIQHYLKRENTELRGQGVYIPKSCANLDGNHSMLSWAVSDDPRIDAKTIISSFKEELDSFRSDAKVIISGEEFEFLQEHHIRRLFALLDELNFDVTIICYLRPQSDLIRSEYIEWLKQGLASDNFSVFWRLHSQLERYDYNKMYSRWGDAFGYEKVSFRSYEEASKSPLGLLGDFLNFCEILGTSEKKTSFNSNVSPSAEVVSAWLLALKNIEARTGHDYSVASYMYSKRDRHLRKSVYKILSDVRKLIEDEVQGTKFIGFFHDEYHQCMSRFDKSNHLLFRRLGSPLWKHSEMGGCQQPTPLKQEIIAKIYEFLTRANSV